MFMLNVFFEHTGNFIWTCVFLPGLLLSSIALSFGCRALQFRRFGYAMKQTIGQAFTGKKSSTSTLSPFQAASTALGSTVGTGNIIGTTQAIVMGGPGALFWIWMAALFSMIVKYSEILLAIYYRRDKIGYGPMDYISHGIGAKKLAVFYGFFALLSSLAMGNLTQASSITDATLSAINSFFPSPVFSNTVSRLSVGFALCASTILILSGGAKSIGKCSEKLVPFMVLLFISVSLAVIIKNLKSLPGVLYTVCAEAFSPGSMCSGVAGISTARCIQWGFRRSAFSNEAGLGTSAIAHASADTDNAAKQGLWGIFEVFADTIVICSCTALCILCSGINIPWGKLGGSELFLDALSTVFGTRLSSLLLSIFMLLFSYTSIIGWALYGTRCSTYLWGSKSIKPYYCVFTILLIFGSIIPLKTVWQLSDFINGIIAVPNLAAVLLLSPIVSHISRDSFP